MAEGEIVAVDGETATIWAQDDVREFERIATHFILESDEEYLTEIGNSGLYHES